jgi:hypothetical protein
MFPVNEVNEVKPDGPGLRCELPFAIRLLLDHLYLVPATEVHDRLDEIEIPGVTESAIPKKAPGSERLLVATQQKMRR